MTSHRTFQFSLLVLLFLGSRGASEFLTPDGSGPCTAISKDKFGVNSVLIRSQMRYDNPLFHYILNKYGIRSVRYPGGSAANYLNWQTGNAVAFSECARTAPTPCPLPSGSPCIGYTRLCKALTDQTGPCAGDLKHFWKAELNNARYRQNGLQISEFTGLLTSRIWNGNLVYVLNVCGMPAKSSGDLARLITAKAAQIGQKASDRVRFELGNEYYFAWYNNCVKNSAEYDILARKHAFEIKKVDPEFKISAVVDESFEVTEASERYVARNPDAPWGKRYRWNRLFPKKTFETCDTVPVGDFATKTTKVTLFDAITRHVYIKRSTATPAETLSEDETNLWKYTKAIRDDLEELLETSSKQFDRPVWLTEYGPGRLADLPGFAGSFYDGMARLAMQLIILTNHRIERSDFHSFHERYGLVQIKRLPGRCDNSDDYMAPMNGTVEQNERTLRERVEIRNGLRVFLDVLAPIYRSCQTAKRIELSGDGSGEISAAVFQCSTTNRAVFLSTTKKPKMFKISDLPGIGASASASSAKIKMTHITPKENNKYDISQTTTDVTGASFSIPGFSVTVVTYEAAAQSSVCSSVFKNWSKDCLVR